MAAYSFMLGGRNRLLGGQFNCVEALACEYEKFPSIWMDEKLPGTLLILTGSNLIEFLLDSFWTEKNQGVVMVLPVNAATYGVEPHGLRIAPPAIVSAGLLRSVTS